MRKTIIHRLSLALLAAVLPVSLALLTPMAASAWTEIQCHPSLSGGAFPYQAYQYTGTPPSCDRSYWWGYTVAGYSTGTAQWSVPSGSRGLLCSAFAWIPDDHSNDPNAQYFLFDGNHYLANDAFVNQQAYTNQWAPIAGGTRFYIYDYFRVTLNDQNPFGQGYWQIAADAMLFDCTGGGGCRSKCSPRFTDGVAASPVRSIADRKPSG